MQSPEQPDQREAIARSVGLYRDYLRGLLGRSQGTRALRYQRVIRSHLAPDILNHSYSSGPLNVKRGRRLTTDQPNDSTPEVWVMGGSTVFGWGVADSETVCSHLQRLLAPSDGATSLRVINEGFFGLTLEATVRRLRARLEEGRPQIVLALFGVNDSGIAHILGKTKAGRQLRVLRRLSTVLYVLARRQPGLFGAASRTMDSLLTARLVRTALRSSLGALEDLRALASCYAFRYTVVLQPNLVTKSCKTKPEVSILESLRRSRKGWWTLELTSRFYHSIRTVLPSTGIVDATAILDRRSDRRVYLDWCHLTGDGNAALAVYLSSLLDTRGPHIPKDS